MYKPGSFIPADLEIQSFDDLKPFLDRLEAMAPTEMPAMERWILDFSDAMRVWEEQSAWAYIHMSCHTDNEDYVARHELLSTVIAPEVSKATNRIQKKMVDHSLFADLPQPRYAELQREFRRDLEMFREENVPLKAKLSALESEFDQIAGGLVATIDGEDLPLPRAAPLLQSPDRNIRKTAWEAIHSARLAVKPDLDELYSKMVLLRHQVALNAGYENYRDFKHDELQRFDYTPQDALDFHDAIEHEVVPLAREVGIRKRDRLGLEGDYRPWDTAGEPEGQEPLRPFKEAGELLEKTITVFEDLNPEFAVNLREMDSDGLFDLDSRKGKAPGGYNYPLAITGKPFIFMNAAGTQGNLETLMHEGGHAQHTFLTANEPLRFYQHSTTEMAETASMAMELLTSPFWDRFYDDAIELTRARREHLEGIITFLPWCAIVDAFQHWVYTNPDHTPAERDDFFQSLLDRFGTGLVDWTDHEHYRRNSWQRQSHIFSVPFYYVEYGIAQLGSLQVFRNYRRDSAAGLEAYIRGLSLGSTVGLPAIWAAMDIEFDFRAEKIRDLMSFVHSEIDALYEQPSLLGGSEHGH